MRGAFGCLFLLVILAGAAFFARDHIRRHPQDVPWTQLDLEHPIGAFTGRKLAALGDGPEQCRALLENAGAEDERAPPVSAGDQCGYDNGIRLRPEGRPVRYTPSPLVASCQVAAAMFILERQVIEPAARRHLGSDVAAIEHFGSYSCRRLYGREEGEFSEHATANALDIAGFRIADASRIRVARDWDSEGPEGRFLREVRDGACKLFSTVLSPDYNAAHADHLHLDQADRGRMGWRLCR
jgi:hypothetical protein